MKKDNVKGYLELVEKDNSVKLKLKEKLDNYKGDMADANDMTQQVIIPIAKDLGFSFTAEEYIKYLENSSKNYELSDDDLFQVAGGTGDVNVENNNVDGDVNIIDNHTETNYYFVFPGASQEALAELYK